MLSIGLVTMSDCRGVLAKKDATIDSLRLENQALTSIVNLRGDTIRTQEAIRTSNQESMRILTDSIFKLKDKHNRRIKEVISYYSERTAVTKKDVFIPYEDTVNKRKFEDSLARVCSEVIKYYEDSSIIVPRKVNVDSGDFKFSGTVLKDGFNIDSFKVIDTQHIRFNVTKGGLLKRDVNGKLKLFTKKKIEVQVLHTNDDLSVTGMKSAVYVPEKKRNLVLKSALLVGGIIIGTQLR